MSLDAAIQTALVRALASPETRDALRRALEPLRTAHSEPDDQAYTVADAARLSGYATDTILERISSRDLAAYKPKGCREWRIRRQDFRAWLVGGGVGAEADHLDPDEVAREMLARHN